MLAWLHPGLLVTVTTPQGPRYVWFDDGFSLARMPDPETVARLMRLQKARLVTVLALAGVAFAVSSIALFFTPRGEPLNPLPYFVLFVVGSGIASAVFARAQRRHIDREPQIALPPEAVARLSAARSRIPFAHNRQRDIACKVAAELVYRQR
jgi:hypothetical protein